MMGHKVEPRGGRASGKDRERSPLHTSRRADRDASTRLRLQVKQSLTRMIQDQAFSEHDRLLSEAERCRRFSVPRTVVREALGRMVHEGMIYRLQGKGGFVREHREEHSFVGSAVGFSGELEKKRRAVTRRVLHQEVMLPTPRMQRFLKAGPTQSVVAIDRVMSVEGIPRAIVRWAMLERVMLGLDTVPVHNRSLHETISRPHGIRLVRAERWGEAVSLSRSDTDLLEVDRGKAALCIGSVGLSQLQSVIENATAHYLTDRSRLRFAVTVPS